MVFRDFKYLFRFIFSNSYWLFLHKILEKHLWNTFLLYLVVEIWNKLLYKRGFLKNFSKFSDKHKEQSSGGVQPKDVFKNLVKFTGKHLCWSLFWIKLEFWGPTTLLKKILTHIFSVKFTNFFMTIVLKNICERLLLNIV